MMTTATAKGKTGRKPRGPAMTVTTVTTAAIHFVHGAAASMARMATIWILGIHEVIGNRSMRNALLTCTALLLLCTVSARAEVTVEVLDTFPAGDTVRLGPNQSFYLHLRYQSDQPLRIWARPLFQGSPAAAGTNPSRIHPAGSGEVLGWFFLSDQDARVDEVQITAGDGSPDGTALVAIYPVAVIGTRNPVPEAAAPAWLGELRQQELDAQRAAYEEAMNTPPDATSILLFNGFMLAMFACGILGLVGPAWCIWRWQGGWRLAAAVPGAIMALFVLRLLVDAARDPTSHNLWPFEVLMVGGLSTVIIGILLVARRLLGVSTA